MNRVPRVVITLIMLIVLAVSSNIIPVRAATTWTVTNLSDSGAGSLRYAIENSLAGDTVTFDPSLSGQTIITSGITINHNLAVDGSVLASKITISGNDLYRVLIINSSVTVTLDSLIITHGKAPYGEAGGGISNSGVLTITNSTISENIASYGGGIYNQAGTVVISNSIISNNSSSMKGGGIYSEGGVVTLSNNTFLNNKAIGGGGVYNANGTMTISNSSFSYNHGHPNMSTYAGGIYNIGTLNINDSTFSNNSAHASGGAIFHSGGTLTITNSIFSNNSTGDNYGTGGGIISNATLTITNSSFSNNKAEYGGAIYNNGTLGILTVTDSTFSNNTATQSGGGVINLDTATMTNSTFYKNIAASEGGAIYSSGTLTVINGTVSNSSANEGGGVFNLGTLNYSNTIIANTATGGDCFSSHVISTNIKNLVEDGSCAAALTGDPILGSLANNGGSTQTMALLTGSPAINAGDNATCAAAPVDNQSQNGVTRPQGTICDIGAVEIPMSLYSSIYKSNAASDGWILESSEFSNTGGSMNSSATNLILGDDAADKQYRAILHFDTSALPDTAVVTNMTLKIKQQGSVIGINPFSFGSLHVDMRNPAFGGSALELADFNSTAKKVKSAVFNSNPVSGWFSARFNTGGNLYVNRTGSTQLRLYFSVDDNDNNAADFIRFYSGDAAAGDRPKLLITYYVP